MVSIKDVRRAARAAETNYLGRKNVVGITPCVSPSKKDPADQPRIQFYLTEDESGNAAKFQPPSFVYARHKDGKIDRKRKILIESIFIKDINFCCGGGSKLKAPSEKGTITIIFENKSSNHYGFFIITCSHVAGTVEKSPPINPRLSSKCRLGSSIKAMTLKNSTHKNGKVEYDIALARIDDSSLPVEVRRIAKTNKYITGVMRASRITPSLPVRCVCARSGRRQGQIRTQPGSFKIFLDGRRYLVKNLIVADFKVQSGDSGGLVFYKEKAVGFVVAQSDVGWALIQPLQPALKYLEKIKPRFPLEMF